MIELKPRPQDNPMDTTNQPLSLRALSVISIVAGLLGGGFYWWVPLGMVLSITGMMFGFVDWVSRPPPFPRLPPVDRRPAPFRGHPGPVHRYRLARTANHHVRRSRVIELIGPAPT